MQYFTYTQLYISKRYFNGLFIQGAKFIYYISNNKIFSLDKRYR